MYNRNVQNNRELNKPELKWRKTEGTKINNNFLGENIVLFHVTNLN